MTPRTNILGLIAGNRSLPLQFARLARSAGVERLVAVGFVGETNPELGDLVDEITWVKVGQLSKMISALKERGVTECVMLGQIAPSNLYQLRPDLRAMSVLFKLKERNAHSLFSAIARELEKDGIDLIEPTPWLKPLMPSNGFHLGPKVSARQQADIEFGFRIAKEVSRLEIGQTVVVKEGTVLAVEGFEGTDLCLSRGGSLAGKNGQAVAVKVAKANHDLRFDIPCVGIETLLTCARAGIAVLAFEAHRTLLLDQPEIQKLAIREKITVNSIQ